MAPTATDFDEFVRDNLDGLVRTACMLVWDVKEAEDVVQECLFKVAGRWSRVRAMDDPLAYTRRVPVRRALRESARRSRRRAELDASTPEFGAEAMGIVGLGARDELFQAMAGLPPRQRAAIVLRYFLDLSEADAARVLDCSPGTVKSNTSKGLTHLRKAFIPDRPATEVCEP
jgi:RNA polymerase sigma-70 factor (sigma-E family)